jgi:hypothetical protein
VPDPADLVPALDLDLVALDLGLAALDPEGPELAPAARAPDQAGLREKVLQVCGTIVGPNG